MFASFLYLIVMDEGEISERAINMCSLGEEQIKELLASV